MNIYLDNIVYSLQPAGGISVYWYELSKRLLASDNDVLVIEEKISENIFRRELSIPSDRIINKSIFPISISRYLPVSFPHKKHDSLFHSSYYRIPADKKLSSVVTVHDFTYEKMKKGIRSIIHRTQKKASLDAAKGIICISEHTKADLLNLYPYLSEKKIAVIYNGVSDLFHPIDKKQLPLSMNNKDTGKLLRLPYALFIGGRESYKNFEFAVYSISLLPDYHLVIIGGGKLLAEETKLLTEKLKDRWHFFTGIETGKLNIFYNFAQFLLYPSAYEGFGIPVIEAEKAGCPVIAMQATSIPEIAANDNLLLHSLEANEFLKKVSLIEAEKDKLILNGFENSSRFGWDKCYKEVISFYNAILQE